MRSRTNSRTGDELERLSRNSKGQVVLQLKSPYRDGTTDIVMSALEFMQRLAALVPRPRLHPSRFHGVLAPHAKHRHCKGEFSPVSARLTAPSTDDSVPASEYGALKSLYAIARAASGQSTGTR
jgi:hypothetical protein